MISFVTKDTPWPELSGSRDAVHDPAPPVAEPAVVEGELLEAIRDASCDLRPREVYADWLKAQGDPRGEFIAEQCVLARGQADASRLMAAYHRQFELLELHLRSWVAPRFESHCRRRALVAGFFYHRFEDGHHGMCQVPRRHCLHWLVCRSKEWKVAPIPEALRARLARFVAQGTPMNGPPFDYGESYYCEDASRFDIGSLQDANSLKGIIIRNSSFAHQRRGHPGLGGLDGIERYANLEHLDIQGTTAWDLTPLASLNKLQVLRLARADVKDLTPLARIPSLVEVDVSFSPARDLQPLYGLSALRRVFVGGAVQMRSKKAIQQLKKRRPDVEVVVFDRSP